MVAGDAVRSLRSVRVAQGQPALLAPMVEDVLAETGLRAAALDAVAVTVGPGSFTGLRAAIALAQGIALAAGRPVLGVTLTEAFAASLPHLGRRRLWVAIDSRRERVFLDTGGGPVTTPLTSLPEAAGPVALAGDAAPQVAAWLAARGTDVMLTDARTPAVRPIAQVAALRLAGGLPPLAVQPLYVDAPEVRVPTEPPRPPPT